MNGFSTTGREPVEISLEFVRRTGGEYLTLLELRSEKDLEVAEVCLPTVRPFGQVCESDSVSIRAGIQHN